jgi:hypothetical protein
MNRKIFCITALLSLVMAAGSYAIDRDARFIDSIGAYGLSYHDGKSTGYAIWGETSVITGSKDWSILLALGMGEESPDDWADTDFWNGALGVKYYVSDLTSVGVVGGYKTSQDSAYDADITSVSVFAKHRLYEIDEGISPFFTASGSYRSYSMENTEDGSELAVSIGAGCEFMITKDLSIAVEASYVHGVSLDSDGPELGSGILGAIYFTGYWQ